jgi:signal transduction histidine kinase
MIRPADALTVPVRPGFLARLVDWFIPESVGGDFASLQQSRIFVIAHLLGPPFGHSITAYLWLIDPQPTPHVWITAGLLTAFFGFPFALKLTGALRLLTILTLQNLGFVILFTAYHYGGVSSPFIGWIAAIPVLGIFYLGPEPKLRLLVLLLLTADLAVFQGFVIYGGPLPRHVPLETLSNAGAYSVFCTVVFISMIGFYYATILAEQQRELQREVEQRRATEAELRVANEQAERASRAKSSFLANMSHELRTPLNAIIGFSEAMTCEMFGPHGHPRYRDYARDILDSGQHLLKIINDILDLSKIEAGKAVLDREERIALAATIGTVERIMRPQAERKAIEFRLDMPHDLPAMFGSARMLDQVLINLLSNAIKFTHPGGTVVLGLATNEEGGLAFTVADSGIGMTESEIRVALAPFGQVDSALNRKYDGTGLGLPLAKAMVELHQGRFAIVSEPGRGTTVRISFPAERVECPALVPAAVG